MWLHDVASRFALTWMYAASGVVRQATCGRTGARSEEVGCPAPGLGFSWKSRCRRATLVPLPLFMGSGLKTFRCCCKVQVLLIPGDPKHGCGTSGPGCCCVAGGASFHTPKQATGGRAGVAILGKLNIRDGRRW